MEIHGNIAEIEDDFNYDYYDVTQDDLFNSTYVNISGIDFGNIAFPSMDEIQDASKDKEENLVLYNDWTFALSVTSGLGILFNSKLVFMIIVDFVIDKKRRLCARHWLLLNTSLTHVVLLSVGIYLKEFGRKLDQKDKTCLIFQHADKAIEFVTVLYLIAIGFNVIGNVVRPHTPFRTCNIIFWISLILLMLVCSNICVLFLFTTKLENSVQDTLLCIQDASLILPSQSVHLVSIVTFFVPYGIVLIIGFSSLLRSCTQHRSLTPSSSADNENCVESKHAVIFLFITSTVGFLLMLPYYILKEPMMSHGVLALLSFHAEHDTVYYVTVLTKLLYYVSFPFMCLMLKEITQIYRKVMKK